MEQSTRVRDIAQRMLDGMTVNKDAFAKASIAVADLADQLNSALQQERKKTEALLADLAQARRDNAALQRQLQQTDKSPARTSEFAQAFSDIFGEFGELKPKR